MDKYRKKYTVTSAQMDADFRLSVAGIAQLFQDCYASYMAYYECAAFDLRKKGLMWIITDFTFQIPGPLPMWGDCMEIELWLSARPSVKVACDYRFINKGRTVIEGTSNWAILETENRQPVVSRDILTRQQVFEDHAVEKRRPRFQNPQEGSAVAVHVTGTSDTDFNSHISNLTYLKTAIDALDINYVKSHATDMVSMRFVHESFLGDTLETSFCNEADEPDMWHFSIAKAKGPVCCQASVRFRAFNAGESEFTNDSTIRQYPA